MTRKRRRLIVLLTCAVGLGTATALVLSAFKDNLVFFLAPAQVAQDPPPAGRQFRLGGLVEQGSVHKTSIDGKPAAAFTVTDGKDTVKVTYIGILPDLFREGQSVVAYGALRKDGVFRASEVLAKHDETYMPKEVEEALKKSGHWNPATGAPPPAATWNTMVPKQSGG